MVDAQGIIYYATDPKTYAVTPDGEILWHLHSVSAYDQFVALNVDVVRL